MLIFSVLRKSLFFVSDFEKRRMEISPFAEDDSTVIKIDSEFFRKSEQSYNLYDLFSCYSFDSTICAIGAFFLTDSIPFSQASLEVYS